MCFSTEDKQRFLLRLGRLDSFANHHNCNRSNVAGGRLRGSTWTIRFEVFESFEQRESRDCQERYKIHNHLHDRSGGDMGTHATSSPKSLIFLWQVSSRERREEEALELPAPAPAAP